MKTSGYEAELYELLERAVYKTTPRGRKRIATKEQYQEAVALGLTAAQFAEQLGVSRMSVYKNAADYGVIFPRDHKTSHITEAMFREGVNLGMTTSQFAKEHGISRITVYNWARHYGLKFRRKKVKPPVKDRLFTKLMLEEAIRAGITAQQFAKKANCNVQTVYRTAKLYGLKFPRPRKIDKFRELPKSYGLYRRGEKGLIKL